MAADKVLKSSDGTRWCLDCIDAGKPGEVLVYLVGYDDKSKKMSFIATGYEKWFDDIFRNKRS